MTQLRIAILAALKASTTLSAALGTRMFDDVPEDPVFPYLTVSAMDESDWSTDTEEGSTVEIQIDVWSRAAGRAECETLLRAVRDAIVGTTLTITGHAHVILTFTTGHVVRDSDGETWHGLARFREWMHPV